MLDELDNSPEKKLKGVKQIEESESDDSSDDDENHGYGLVNRLKSLKNMVIGFMGYNENKKAGVKTETEEIKEDMDKMKSFIQEMNLVKQKRNHTNMKNFNCCDENQELNYLSKSNKR